MRRFKPDGTVLARWALGLCALSACLNPMPDDFPNQNERPVTVGPATTGAPDETFSEGASGGAGGGVEPVPPSEQPEDPQGAQPDAEAEPDAGVPASLSVGDAGVFHGTP